MSESNWRCKRCGFELVEVSKEYLLSIKDALYIKYLLKTWEKRKSNIIRICPRCDDYALGIEFIEGPPLRKKTGKITTIQEIAGNDL
ncbi:MAG: hypothetical protein EOM37_12835 [Proteobacteria bacterium]|nr:hypothetical protein [Pseudomonadota bacterium]